jgi:hypothetical protein
MVGVWIEPVIAQLMMILFATMRFSPLHSRCGPLGDGVDGGNEIMPI